MLRSKRILLLSHCLLNVNAKVYKLANYEGCFETLILPLMKDGYGFIQLPCPELITCGVNRWGQVKEQYETEFFKEQYKSLLKSIIYQLLDYKNNGYTISGCIGIDGSPNCGITKTTRGKWGGEIDDTFNLEETLSSTRSVNEKGVYMEVFSELLDRNNLNLKFYAVDEADPSSSVENILKELL